MSQGKKIIAELPKQGDPFWLDADNAIFRAVRRTCDNGGHLFKQIKGIEAECIRCNTGFVLTPGMEVKEGHIYNKDELVV